MKSVRVYEFPHLNADGTVSHIEVYSTPAGYIAYCDGVPVKFAEYFMEILCFYHQPYTADWTDIKMKTEKEMVL